MFGVGHFHVKPEICYSFYSHRIGLSAIINTPIVIRAEKHKRNNTRNVVRTQIRRKANGTQTRLVILSSFSSMVSSLVGSWNKREIRSRLLAIEAHIASNSRRNEMYVRVFFCRVATFLTNNSRPTMRSSDRNNHTSSIKTHVLFCGRYLFARFCFRSTSFYNTSMRHAHENVYVKCTSTRVLCGISEHCCSRYGL